MTWLDYSAIAAGFAFVGGTLLCVHAWRATRRVGRRRLSPNHPALRDWIAWSDMQTADQRPIAERGTLCVLCRRLMPDAELEYASLAQPHMWCRDTDDCSAHRTNRITEGASS
jgi:hypothetical protein